MSRPLLELVARCQLRRARASAQHRPLVSVVVAVSWLAAPLAAWRLGAGLREALAAALEDPSAARALVLGTCLAAAALGTALALSFPGRLACGPQVASSPITRRVATVAVMAPVVCGAVVLLAPTAAALVLSIVAPSRGVAATAVLALSLAVAVCAGAAGAESLLHLARLSSPIRSAAALGCSAAIFAIAVMTGTVGLTGATGASVAAVVALVAGSISGEVWLRLAAARPDPAPRRQRLWARAPGRRTIVLASALAVLSRSAELRWAVITAASFGVIGLAVGLASGAPIPVALLLGGGSCAVTVSLVPLSVRGRIDPGAWAWRSEARRRIACAWALASLLLVAVSLVPVHAIAAPAAGTSLLGASAQVAALASFAWAAALVAGAWVPRRRRGAGDDALSLAAFTAVAVTGGGVASFGGRWLGVMGVPDGLAAALVLVAAAIGAVAVLGAAWGQV